MFTHTLHNDINDQCVSSFHLVPHTAFFIDSYYDSNEFRVVSFSGLIGVADRTLDPLQVGVERFLRSQAHSLKYEPCLFVDLLPLHLSLIHI